MVRMEESDWMAIWGLERESDGGDSEVVVVVAVVSEVVVSSDIVPFWREWGGPTFYWGREQY